MDMLKNDIAENYVSFELAQLLKDKGFKSEAPHYYNSSGELIFTLHTHTNNIMQRFRYEAPSLSIAQKWIYENFGIWVYSAINLPHSKDWFFSCENRDERFIIGMEGFENPYQALNEGLIYALKNLIS
jgi:hypothetical protein